VAVVFGVIVPVLGLVAGLAAVRLLWRPASSAFFKPQGVTPSGSGAQLSSRIGSSRATVAASVVSRAALTAAIAPGIPIIDADIGPDQGIEGPDRAASIPEPGPAHT
jgi:hypothetical protein